MGLALVAGVALLFGAPLLAEDPPPAHPEGAEVAPEAHDTEADPGVEPGGHAEHAVGEAHGEVPQEEGGSTHPPNLVTLLAEAFEGAEVHDPAHAHNPVARFLLTYQAPIFSFIVIVLLCTLCIVGARSMTLVPGRFQNLVEWALEGLDGFIRGVIGPEGARFVPFLGTLFLYIYFQNILGLFPFFFTPTSVVESTAALGIIVFVYVQWTAVRSNGPVGYLKHLAGDPKDGTGWAMVPLLLPLHIVGELAKPLSLSLRLFGNMMGEETLIAVFLGLGVAALAFTHLPVGLPLQTPFLFLALLTTAIQALVFTLLSTIYFALVLPHHEGEGAH
jgi:F-type H+-transporting ATPase subunit a